MREYSLTTTSSSSPEILMVVRPVKATPLICTSAISEEEGVVPQRFLIQMKVQGRGLYLQEGGIILP